MRGNIRGKQSDISGKGDKLEQRARLSEYGTLSRISLRGFPSLIAN